MKVCPKCSAVIVDDAQKFCLMDGSELVAGDSEPTVVMPPSGSAVTAPTMQRRRKSPLIWVVLALVTILVALTAVVGVALYSYKLGIENARNEKTPNANVTTRSSSPVKATPVPSPSVSSDTTNAPEATPDADQIGDEATPITWTTSASTFKNDVGLSYTFYCPPDGTAGTVWGSDVYTTDSSICTAAVHAGRITLERGGDVTIELVGGRQTYGATVRNGITTYNYGPFQRSYIFTSPNAKKGT